MLLDDSQVLCERGTVLLLALEMEVCGREYV